ncbi:hypothetical protein [Novosphingobium rosa]|uniref:hypothetical protein n=1 Tax=Novosphingobium rosa TaxID=76978 RepID=UPI000837511E|nr:hypothetical protein [Novosphingobium rosa]
MTGRAIVPVDTSIDPASVPTAIFARSFSSRPVPAGTEVALELRGGDRLGPAGIMFDLDMDWEPEFLGAVENGCSNQRIRGRDWFSLPGILLGGPVGAGRTHVARRLARAAGVPHILFDAATDMFTRHCARPDVPLPLPIAPAIMACGCANPVVSIVGIEAASEDMVTIVSRLVDGATNSGFPDQALSAAIDYSAVTWIVQARDADEVPDRLASRLDRIDLRGGEREDRDLRIIDVLAEVLADRAIGLPPGIDLEDLLGDARRWVRDDPSTAKLYRRVDDRVGIHAPPF